MSKLPSFAKQDKDRGTKLEDYRPLIVLVGIAVLAAFALARQET